MSKVKVKTTIEVLGHKLSRKEAEALYHDLQRELKMVKETVTVPYPVYPYRYFDWRNDIIGTSAGSISLQSDNVPMNSNTLTLVQDAS